MEELARQGRLVQVASGVEIAPGIVVEEFSGHTPGQLVTRIAATDRQVVLASDALHFYDEMDRDRPALLFTDMERLLDSYAALLKLDAQPDTYMIPGHDPVVAHEYVEVKPDVFDLLRRREGVRLRAQRERE